MINHLQDVAIIGAGLGGCALALALSAHGVKITLYESREPESAVFTSGVVLTPNGLYILDRLGVLIRIKDRCYKTVYRTFKNDRDETLRKTVVADESLYGYCNHRVWRKTLLDELRQMLAERSVPIQYTSRFNGVVSDSPDGVSFMVNDEEHRASLLIGSDGIYSMVRRHLDPEIVPEYTGIVGVLSHIKRASVSWPYEDYERNCTIQGKPGALFFIPEDPAAENIMIGLQVQHPQQTREDLDRLQLDKDKLVDFYRKGYDDWGPTARSIIDRVSENKETCFIWPYLRMPKLQRWYSNTGRIVIVGDGAHALPPSSGQGINQALEDAYSLSMLLTSINDGSAGVDGNAVSGLSAGHESSQKVTEALSYWQALRQKRVDQIYDWATNATNVQRLPEAERKKLMAEGKIKEGKAGEGDDMSWLYAPTLEKEVKSWIDSKS